MGKQTPCEKCGADHETHRADGRKRCQKHRTKIRPYVQCGANAMPNSCCYMHGGATPKGPANANFKDGSSSSMFVDRLAGRLLDDYLATPESHLSSFDEDIRLFEARRGEIVDRLVEGETTDAWKRVRQAFAAVRKASDAKSLDHALTTLGEVVEAGGSREEGWRDLRNATDHLRKLRKERVRKAQVETAYVPIDEMVLWARFSTRLAVECIQAAAEEGAAAMLSKFLGGVNEFAQTHEIKQISAEEIE